MKPSKFTDNQIISTLKQTEGIIPVTQVCRERNICSATFYKWHSKFSGMDASLIAHMRELEQENARLKKMCAKERFKYEIIQGGDVKKW